MSFISLPTSKLHKKPKTKKPKTFPVGYVRKFYRNLAQDIDILLTKIFMVKYLTMQKYHQKVFKNIFWRLVILPKVCKMI